MPQCDKMENQGDSCSKVTQEPINFKEQIKNSISVLSQVSSRLYLYLLYKRKSRKPNGQLNFYGIIKYIQYY